VSVSKYKYSVVLITNVSKYFKAGILVLDFGLEHKAEVLGWY